MDWYRTNKDLKTRKEEIEKSKNEAERSYLKPRKVTYYPNLQERINELKLKNKMEDSAIHLRNMAEAIKKFPQAKKERLIWLKDALGISLDVNEFIKSMKQTGKKDSKNIGEYNKTIDQLQSFKDIFDTVFYSLDEARIDEKLQLDKENKTTELIQEKVAVLTETKVLEKANIAADAILDQYPFSTSGKMFSNDPLYLFQEKIYALSSEMSEQTGRTTTKESKGTGLHSILDGLGKWDDTNYYWKRFQSYNEHFSEYTSRINELREIAAKSGPEYSKYFGDNVERKFNEYSGLIESTVKTLNEKEFKITFVKRVVEKAYILGRALVPKVVLTSIGSATFTLSRMNVFKKQTVKDELLEGELIPILVDENKKDLAMNGQTKNGGIDLTPGNMNLITKNGGAGIKFYLDPMMLQRLENAPGFIPVIINIQPLNSLQKFLGIA